MSALVIALRQYAARLFPEVDLSASVNGRGDLSVVQGLPPATELVRLGQSWSTVIPLANAFTYVNALPTTRAELVLRNADPLKSLVIENAYLLGVTSQAAAQHSTLLVQNVPVVATDITDNAAVLITSRSGKTAYTGKVKRALANTTAGQIADKWDVVGSVVSPMTTNLGAALLARLYGSYIVPPGGVFALAGLAGSAAGTAIIGVTWHEVLLDLGNS